MVVGDVINKIRNAEMVWVRLILFLLITNLHYKIINISTGSLEAHCNNVILKKLFSISFRNIHFSLFNLTQNFIFTIQLLFFRDDGKWGLYSI